jgi:hypothetical protein
MAPKRGGLADQVFDEAADGSKWCRLCKNWVTEEHLISQKHATELGKWHVHMRNDTWQDCWYHDMPVTPPADSDGKSDGQRAAVRELMKDFGPFMQRNLESAMASAYEKGYNKGYVEAYDAQIIKDASAARDRSRSRRKR